MHLYTSHTYIAVCLKNDSSAFPSQTHSSAPTWFASNHPALPHPTRPAPTTFDDPEAGGEVDAFRLWYQWVKGTQVPWWKPQASELWMAISGGSKLADGDSHGSLKVPGEA